MSMGSKSLQWIGALIVLAISPIAARAELIADEPMAYTPGSGELQRHQAIIEQGKKMPDANLIFIGDSITHFWESAGKAVWDKSYGPRKAINMGVSGDRTMHVLWRLGNGEIDGIHPKLVVILIGTNNTWGNEVPVDANVRGIRKIVEMVGQKLPKTRILLLALFPREDPNTNGKWKQVNAELEKIQWGENVHYLDIGPKFLDGHGKIARGFSGDKLHLATDGYQIWADAIEPYVAAALDGKPLPATQPSAAAPAPAGGHLRKFDAKTPEEAIAWQRECVSVMSVDKRMAPIMGQRNAAGPEKEWGRALNSKIVKEIDKGKYMRQEVAFDVYDNWRPTAIVTVPKEGKAPFPAVIFIEGKVERPYESSTACGTMLAERGYVTLSIDVNHDNELGGHERLLPGFRAVDYLYSRPDVNKEKIGMAGLCRWGAIATFNAQFDPRVKAVVGAAVLFKDSPNGRYYATKNGDPHDFRDCYAMLAPRPLLVQFGKGDGYGPMFPSEADLNESRKAYQVFGCPERLEVFWHPGGHMIEGSSLPAFFEKAFKAK